MSKAVLPALVAVLVLASGALFSDSSSAQAVPSTKVSSALAPLFAKPRKAQVPIWPGVFAMALEALLSGTQISGDTCIANTFRAQAYHPVGKRFEERKALQGMIDSGLLEGNQLAPLVRRLEALEAQ